MRRGPPSDRTILRAAAALIALAVPLAHLPLARSGYIQDDRVAVEANPIVERGAVGEILATTYWEGAEGEDRSLYRPLVILSFAAERALAGRAAAPLAHAVNVALHALVSLGLLALLRRLGAGAVASAVAAVLFALHPVHVEAVAGLVGRAELLAALFSIAALRLATHAGPWPDSGARDTTGRRRAAAWGAGLALFLALASKEVALATAPLLVAAEWLFRPPALWRRRAGWIDRAVALVPAAAAVLLYAALRIRATGSFLALQPIHPFDNPLVELSGEARIASALALLARYVRLALLPFGLSADYAGPVLPAEPRLLAPLPLVGLAGLLALVALVLGPLVVRSRASILASFGSLLFLLPYLIVGNLLFPIGAILAERLLYLPSAGLVVLLAIAAAAAIGRGSAPVRRRIAVGLLLALVSLSAALTFTRCLDWRDDETLFRAAVRVRPASPRALLILGKIHADRGEPDRALAVLDRCVAAAPELVAAWVERGTVLGQMGRLEEAVTSLGRAVELGPRHATAHLNLAIALSRLGRPDEAERSVRRALLWDPTLDKGWATLGHLRLARRDYSGAVEAYHRAIALGRTDLARPLGEAERGVESSATRQDNVRRSAPSPEAR